MSALPVIYFRVLVYSIANTIDVVFESHQNLEAAKGGLVKRKILYRATGEYGRSGYNSIA